MLFGRYPAEYNPRIHGPYIPGRYYGKPDLHISEVKLGQLGQWLSRRNMSPFGMINAVGRANWRWMQRWIMVKKPSMAGYAQVLLGISAIYYYGYYHAMIKYEKHAKYH